MTSKLAAKTQSAAMLRQSLFVSIVLGFGIPAFAEVGDPQIRTDHPWYPGELAISNFDRLFQTQRDLYERVTGQDVESDEDKAIASWLWRNTHYWHGEAGRRDLWGEGFQSSKDARLREYWSGLFAYGFGLCGTTHSQWSAEFEQLLGHGRGRGVGAAGHNAFEVFLKGGAYGKEGRWALLDHDLSTIIFDPTGQRLLGLGEMQSDVDRWIDRSFKPERQHGWLVCGLHPSDGNSYRSYAVAEYLPGYAGPPPKLRLRRGERMRRYFQPGLEDGKTFVFWGRNYNTDGIPGPERSRTWVNQPEKMYGSKTGTPHRNGQVRFANVEYVYRPDFQGEDYREGVVDEADDHVVFGFQTPYVIAATPPNENAWGIYDEGCTNGLLLLGQSPCEVSVSVDAGRSWSTSRPFVDGVDLTDLVKGRNQYWLRLSADNKAWARSAIEIRTVCQSNAAVLPRLKDNGTIVSYEASGEFVSSLGPESDLSSRFVTDGGFGESSVTLTASPRSRVVGLYAAAHVASSSPPDPNIKYQIEYSFDRQSWSPLVADWNVPRRGDEPNDFWSQSFCHGSCRLKSASEEPIHIRFRNNGGKRYLRAEAHLTEKTMRDDPVKVSYRWKDSLGTHQESKVFAGDGEWQIRTAVNVETDWVEFETMPSLKE
ncbi:MAG: hypothetical protein AAFX06_04355 [Planctomycetota bacterium]